MEKRKLLNLGCGNRYHKDWVNMDFTSRNKNIISHNILKGIPFPDSYFDAVYHSHVLEHFSKADAFKFIRECYRVLKPGGIIRIAVPNLESIVENYKKYLKMAIKGDEIAEANYDWSMIEMYDQCVRSSSGGEMRKYLSQDNIINKEFITSRIGTFANFSQNSNEKKENKVKNLAKEIIRFIKKVGRIIPGQKNWTIGKFRMSGETHQWMYDRFSLSRLLRNEDFNNPTITNAYNSMIIGWSEFNLDADKEGKIFKPDSLFMEAIK